MLINLFDYTKRRSTLINSLGSGQILLLGNTLLSKNFKDNTYPFRQDSSFLYYIGISAPDLCALIDCDSGEVTLYGNEASIEDIIWIGQTEKLTDIARQVGIDKVKKNSNLESDVTSELHTLPTYTADQTLLLSRLTGSANHQPSAPLITAVITQRNIKSPIELEQLDTAVSISNKMHRALMQKAKPGMQEYELASIASQIALENNTVWAYQPILTVNGQVLHNHSYSNKLAEGDLILYDGGAELPSGYCGDITRTFPVSTSFTTIQKEIYEIVLSAYQTAAQLSKPGTTFKDIHLKVAGRITQGLKDIGWMKGNVSEAVAAGAHSLFFPHGLGHMIGLDVHDMENLGELHVGYEPGESKSTEFGLKSLRLARSLKEGFCVTIEPGIYVIPQLIDKLHSEGKHMDFINYDTVNKHRNFSGIRIEDNFVITSDGNRRLGDGLVLESQDIEEIRLADVPISVY